MSRRIVLSVAFVMLLVALPLISIGSVNGTTEVWVTGLIVLAGGFFLPLALRFIHLIQTADDEPGVGEEPS